jgi:hypothetical protein
VFANGYVYEVDGDGEDQVHGEPLDSAPVKREDTEPASPELKELLKLTKKELVARAEESKTTFDESMTKREIAQALLSTPEAVPELVVDVVVDETTTNTEEGEQ